MAIDCCKKHSTVHSPNLDPAATLSGIPRSAYLRKKAKEARRGIQERSSSFGLNGLQPKQISLVFVLSGRGRETLRCSESFSDNSKVRLRCKSKTRPSGSNSWIYGRFAVLRIVSEKILIRAQGSLPRPLRLPLRGRPFVAKNPLLLLSVVICPWSVAKMHPNQQIRWH